MAKEKKHGLRIVFNSPVVLTFSIICCIALILDKITGGWANVHLFSVYRSSLASPMTFLRFFTHVFGHASISHLSNNLMMILILGPMLEEKHGAKDLVFVIASTAICTGLVNYIFFPNTMLLGASGVVFAFILLSSVTGAKQGQIPVTLILVMIVYLGEEVYNGVFMKDNVSQLTHIIGGLVGALLGYIGQDRD